MISTKSKRKGGETAMGGRGSGHWYRWGTRDTTGEYRSIDIRQWGREGWLRPGAWFISSWLRDGAPVASIEVLVPAGPAPPARLVLAYRQRTQGGPWQDVTEPVTLLWTPCHYGGRRPWFLCPGPGCGRRVALLYLGGAYWACRQCLGLAYQSQREDWGSRQMDKAQRIRRRLGGMADLTAPFPAKPPRMHRRTYERLQAEAEAAEFGALTGLLELLNRLGDPL
jgi:hypothetical protein